MTILVAVMAISCFGQHKVKQVNGEKYPGRIIEATDYGYRFIPNAAKAYQIGDTIGKGVVFWLDPRHSQDGGVSSIHGLIAAFPDRIDTAKYGNATISQAYKSDGYYAGFHNTVIIAATDATNNTAAKKCLDRGVGVGAELSSDWYLPSTKEMETLLTSVYNGSIYQPDSSNIVNNGFPEEEITYWTSVEDETNTTRAYASTYIFEVDPFSGSLSISIASTQKAKNTTYKVWAIRRF